MKIEYIEKISILTFEKVHDLELIVKEQKTGAGIIFQASFKGTEISEAGMFLKSAYGVSTTVKVAILDYCRQLSHQKIVVNAFSEARKEINIPILIYEGE